MAFYSIVCASTNFAIQRQRYTAVYLFSILIFFASSFVSSAQTDSLIQLVTIDNGNYLSRFFNDKIIKESPSYSIIHFGDSHIQGDRITDQIRSDLQALYGNGGTGIIFPYSLTGSYGPLGTKSTVKGSYTYSSQLKNPSAQRIGMMGYELKLAKGAEFNMTFNEKFKGRLTDEVDIWTHSFSDSLLLTFEQKDLVVNCRKLEEGIWIYKLKSTHPIDTIYFKTNDECSLWGIQFTPNNGIVYQQSGVVGAQFTHLIKYKNDLLIQLKEMNPNLLIFSYGTNESYASLDTANYERLVRNFLKDLQLQLPKTGILLTNAPDTRSGGRIPSNERPINRTLKRVSNDLGISFFDANLAMGGWGSLYTWNKVGYFNKDLLHFSSTGAKMFGKLILYGLLNLFDCHKKINEDLAIEIRSLLPKNEVATEKSDLIINTPKTLPEPPIQKKSNYYIVRNGDTLSNIASKKGCSVSHLVTKNNLKSADKIKPGQRIYY